MSCSNLRSIRLLSKESTRGCRRNSDCRRRCGRRSWYPLVISYSCCFVVYSKAHGGRTGADDMMLQENILLTRNQLDQCLKARRRYRTRTRNQITAKVCMEDLISSLCDEQTLPADSSLLDSGKNKLFYRSHEDRGSTSFTSWPD